MTFVRSLQATLLPFAPAAILWALVLLPLLPRHTMLLGALMPAFGLITIYYWGLFRPRSLPSPYIFFIGLVQDVLSGMPLGLSSLLFLLMRWVVLARRRTLGIQLFVGLWASFALISLALLTLQWMMISTFSGAWLAVDAPLVQWAITAAFYPLFHAGFNKLYATLSPRHPKPKIR